MKPFIIYLDVVLLCSLTRVRGRTPYAMVETWCFYPLFVTLNLNLFSMFELICYWYLSWCLCDNFCQLIKGFGFVYLSQSLSSWCHCLASYICSYIYILCSRPQLLVPYIWLVPFANDGLTLISSHDAYMIISLGWLRDLVLCTSLNLHQVAVICLLSHICSYISILCSLPYLSVPHCVVYPFANDGLILPEFHFVVEDLPYALLNMCCLNLWTWCVIYKFISHTFYQSTHAPTSLFAHIYMRLGVLKLTTMVHTPLLQCYNYMCICVWVFTPVVLIKLVYLRCFLPRF